MIISQSKLEDMAARDMMLEAMEIMIRTGDMESAKSFGESARKMKERIQTKDYSGEDAVLEKIQVALNMKNNKDL